MGGYRMSGAAQRAIGRARREALALGHARLTPAHLVIALALEPGAAERALAAAGLKPDPLRRAVDAGYDGPRGGKARDLDEADPALLEVYATAGDEADAEGEHDIAPVRLFLAATEEAEGPGVAALAAAGVDVERARAAARDLARDEAQGSLPSP
jgi:ATP-dependent Clp protease ATP-binding subunit ClpA